MGIVGGHARLIWPQFFHPLFLADTSGDLPPLASDIDLKLDELLRFYTRRAGQGLARKREKARGNAASLMVSQRLTKIVVNCAVPCCDLALTMRLTKGKRNRVKWFSM